MGAYGQFQHYIDHGRAQEESLNDVAAAADVVDDDNDDDDVDDDVHGYMQYP